MTAKKLQIFLQLFAEEIQASSFSREAFTDRSGCRDSGASALARRSVPTHYFRWLCILFNMPNPSPYCTWHLRHPRVTLVLDPVGLCQTLAEGCVETRLKRFGRTEANVQQDGTLQIVLHVGWLESIGL